MIEEGENSKRYLALITLGALGVVFGDIGTSPLYALRECFNGTHAVAVSQENILGVLSLIFWSLVIVVSLKYLVYVMKADNRGEGGVLALMALAHPKAQNLQKSGGKILIYLGLFGAALLYGDGMITPAISVLSAVEGIQFATPLFSDFVVPITCAILFTIFFVQRHGTGRIGKVFGPVILTWFTTLAVLGVYGISLNSDVLGAINPLQALSFLYRDGWHSCFVLGGVFLVVTGGEALFADMGHFGRLPIRLGWFVVALPALLLNYFGQGALLLTNPEAAQSPFFLLAPEWARIPLVVLATLATVIASQAVITGAFSLTRQAVQLGYLPRIAISHTSSEEIGQIYVSLVNRILLIFTLWLVLEFRTSSNLAAAYGIAVSTTMIITTILMFFVAQRVWGWKLWTTALVSGSFLVLDIVFFGANIIKIEHGGWFPLCVAAVAFTLMSTWHTGRGILAARLRAGLLPLESFVKDIAENPPIRVGGTAIFLSRNVDTVPPALLHHVEHNKVLHDQVAIMMVVTEEVPHVETYDRVQIEGLGHGFHRIIAHYGFMESPNVPEVLRLVQENGFDLNPKHVTFFLGSETIIPTDRKGMAIWREEVFAFMSRNAERPTEFFKIPRDRVVEIGIQVEI